MKRDRLFSAFSDIDDTYIGEARAKKQAKKKNKWIRFGVVAAAFLLLCSWLFIPYSTNPDKKIVKYQGSEYYPVISKLNTHLYSTPKYKNNFDKIFSNLVSCGMGKNDMAGGSAPDMENGSSAPESSYEETTDNQVAGVIEADLIKRTTTHFFYLDQTTVKVYSIAGEESALVSQYEISRPEGATYLYASSLEFYLSTDTKRLTVICPYEGKTTGAAYDIISLSVENPESISELARVTVSGSYTSSRLVNGTLLVVGAFYTKASPDYDEPQTYVPSYDTGDGMECFPMEDIIVPEKVTNRRYTVLTKMDEETLRVEDTTAVLSYSTILYVSENTVYLTQGINEKIELNEQSFNVSKTEILAIDYTGETFLEKGSATVNGYLENQYSLDEHEGKLRVVTTTSKNRVYNSTSGVLFEEPVSSIATGTNASLFVIDLTTMEIVASVEDFAPQGESVRSVRFDGNYAYVCTAVQISDPVFFFDLSDLENITYKDTGTITGFSTSLIQLGRGFLLGIGRGNGWDTVKVEVYMESETGVVSVAKYEIQDANYTSDYKTYLIDRKNGLFGFACTGYTKNGSYGYYYGESYVVLHFDGYALHELVKIAHPAGQTTRAIHVDGYVYFFGQNAFAVRSIES